MAVLVRSPERAPGLPDRRRRGSSLRSPKRSVSFARLVLSRRATSDGGASARRRRPCIRQCAARINPMNTLVNSVNTNACKNATNSSSSMIPVAMADAATPTR